MQSLKNQPKNHKNLHRQILIAAGAFALVAIYLIIFRLWGWGIPCWWHLLTGWYCPGCGLTRMLEALVMGNFYQAFRFNPLLFVVLPFGVLLLIDYCRHRSQPSDALVKRIPEWFWVSYIILAIIYAVLRNLAAFSFLAPTQL